jgi:hypothetical protein
MHSDHMLLFLVAIDAKECAMGVSQGSCIMLAPSGFKNCDVSSTYWMALP